MLARRRGARCQAVFALAVAVLIVTAGPLAARADAGPVTSTTAIVPGAVARWGDYFGAPGNIQRKPGGVAGLANVVAIDASNSSNYALECAGGVSNCPTDGTVMAWGDGGLGQLGGGVLPNSQSTAHPVLFPTDVHIVSIGEAKNEGLAVDSTGQGWGWGANGKGSLCIGNANVQVSPVQIPGLTDVTAVQGGQNHVLWLRADGKVMACGENGFGQLGTGTTNSSMVPVPVMGLSHIVQITAGNTSSGALDGSGNVYMWGFNREGQTGVGSQRFVSIPTKVKLPLPAVSLSAGGDTVGNGHTIAVLNDHSVYAWGDDSNGQLGDGQKKNEFSPVTVDVPSGVTFTSAVAGGIHSLGLDTHGNVYAWGAGTKGQLGAGSVRQSLSPVKVDSGVDMISATALDSLDHHS